MISELYDIILDRKRNQPPGSYTAKLLQGGQEIILKKVGEETVEVILAATGQGKHRVIEETADLLYHTLVLLASQDIPLNDVQEELRQRHLKQGS